MNQMELKLEEYRLRKRRKEKFEEFKDIIRGMLTFVSGASGGNNDEKRETHVVDLATTNDENTTEEHHLQPISEDDLVLSTDDDDQEVTIPLQPADAADDESKTFKYTLWTVYFLFWTTLYVIAIELKFGIVFLMFSALFGIYFNTKTGPKKRNEISAYSVFNKNCVAIDGTLNAEQFEREIRYGPTSVK